MFFHCRTQLVATFRTVYPDLFDFEENRAIRFSTKKEPDLKALQDCVQVALNYHSLKSLPLLGLTVA